MSSLFRILMGVPILRPILKPVTRLFISLIAIPVFRLILRKVFRLQDMDAELEKDLEQWFRGALLLFIATRNMEEALFGWVTLSFEGDYGWITMGLRLLLAIGVVEGMPDQELFAIIHPGPPKIKFTRKRSFLQQVREIAWPFTRGILCQHLNRSSPVFAIMAAVAPGWVGWTCYLLAITQYLIIGLVTSRDRAMDVLSVFDRQVAERREDLIREFHLGGQSGTEDPEHAVSPDESLRDITQATTAETGTDQSSPTGNVANPSAPE